jgi:hypothetical protein
MLADKIGFKKTHIIGNAPLYKDLMVYSRGFASAVLEIFQQFFQERLRGWYKDKLRIEKKAVLQNPNKIEDIIKYCRSKAAQINADSTKIDKDIITNKFSSGIILFAFKS